MKYRYGSYRANGEDMTGKEMEMTEDEARPLVISNIVVPVVETASVEPSENVMVKRAKPRRVNNRKGKTKH